MNMWGGDLGVPGSDGRDGVPGSDGRDGDPGTNGLDGFPGSRGKCLFHQNISLKTINYVTDLCLYLSS